MSYISVQPAGVVKPEPRPLPQKASATELVAVVVIELAVAVVPVFWFVAPFTSTGAEVLMP